MNIKYILGVFISIPLLPILFFQGKRIKKETPRLPEAKQIKGGIKRDSQKTVKLIIIGESTIAGVGVDYHKNGFTGALAKELANKCNVSVSWKVYAKSGYTAKLVRERIIPKIKEQDIDLIVIGLGGNDAFTLNSPAKWAKEINLMIDQLYKKFPNTPVFFTNMPPIKEFPAFTKLIKFVIGNLVEVLGEALHKEVKQKNNVYYNDEIITLKTWKEKFNIEGNVDSFFSDGVHPSKITYQVWGKDMAAFIMNTKSFNLWMHKK